VLQEGNVLALQDRRLDPGKRDRRDPCRVRPYPARRHESLRPPARRRRRVDVAIEAVSVPATFDICQSILAPGGRLANVGVHGKPVELHIEKLWSQNITLTTRLVDTVSTSMLLKVVQSGRLDPRRLVTHRFALADVMKAYDTFGNAAKERALKVVLKNA